MECSIDRSSSCDFFLLLKIFCWFSAGGVELTEKPQDGDDIAGSDMSLVCSAKGSPRPTIVWLLNGVKVEESNRLTIEDKPHGGDSVTSTLKVLNVSASDEGVYQCQAANRFETVAAQALRTVKSKWNMYVLHVPLIIPLISVFFKFFHVHG